MGDKASCIQLPKHIINLLALRLVGAMYVDFVAQAVHFFDESAGIVYRVQSPVFGENVEVYLGQSLSLRFVDKVVG